MFRLFICQSTAVASLVAQVSAEVESRITTTRKTKAKNFSDMEKDMKAAQKWTMKWLPFMSKFVLQRMCELVKSGVQTDKGFKEVRMTAATKALMEHYGDDVSYT
jgi:hypothetical protein